LTLLLINLELISLERSPIINVFFSAIDCHS
jgi:hypothetical protein